MPTCDSIQAFRGASLRAMMAPMNGMNTGAPTFNPSRLAASRCPHSCTRINSTNPNANQAPQIIAYTQIVRTIVPPVLRITGRNFSTGKMMNFSLAKNFKNKAPTTASGASSFFIFCRSVGPGGRPQLEELGAGGAGESSSLSIAPTILSAPPVASNRKRYLPLTPLQAEIDFRGNDFP